MRIWFKLWKENRMLQDLVIENSQEDTRTHKIFDSLEQACYHMDFGHPIWLEANIQEFKRLGKTRFSQDHFIEEISFDYLEIHVLEED